MEWSYLKIRGFVGEVGSRAEHGIMQGAGSRNFPSSIQSPDRAQSNASDLEVGLLGRSGCARHDFHNLRLSARKLGEIPGPQAAQRESGMDVFAQTPLHEPLPQKLSYGWRCPDPSSLLRARRRVQVFMTSATRWQKIRPFAFTLDLPLAS